MCFVVDRSCFFCVVGVFLCTFISANALGGAEASPLLCFAIWWSVWSYWMKFDVSPKTYWVG